MKQDVLITLRGTQTVDREPPQTVELVTRGTMTGRNGKFAISYVETELTGNNEHFYSLTFDVDAIEGQRDSLLLLVDDNIFSPSLVTPTQVRFDSVWFPPDTSFFTLGRGSVLWNRQLANTNYAHGVGSTIPGSNIQTSIYPNPSLGQYTLEVSDAGWVKAVIYNTLGAVVATHEGSDKRQYLFSGALPTGNVYYVTVTTEAGASTTKLVVK